VRRLSLDTDSWSRERSLEEPRTLVRPSAVAARYDISDEEERYAAQSSAATKADDGPTTWWNHIVPYLGKHNRPPPLFKQHHISRQMKEWSKQKHRQFCDRYCECCIAENRDGQASGCKACFDMWSCMCVEKRAREVVSAYDGVSNIRVGEKVATQAPKANYRNWSANSRPGTHPTPRERVGSARCNSNDRRATSIEKDMKASNAERCHKSEAEAFMSATSEPELVSTRPRRPRSCSRQSGPGYGEQSRWQTAAKDEAKTERRERVVSDWQIAGNKNCQFLQTNIDDQFHDANDEKELQEYGKEKSQQHLRGVQTFSSSAQPAPRVERSGVTASNLDEAEPSTRDRGRASGSIGSAAAPAKTKEIRQEVTESRKADIGQETLLPNGDSSGFACGSPS
jgi:hypothetical protein